ncbi:MAG TPA: TonB family protein [Pedobacter sp.]
MLNISSNLYKSAWTNLIFKNRNQAYGAYQLRAESASITLKALFITAPVFIMLFAGPAIYKRLHPDVMMTNIEMKPVDLVQLPPVTAIKPPAEKMDLPKAVPAEEKLKTVKVPAHIQVVADPVTEETMPSLDELKDAVVGQVTQSGTATQASATPVTSSGNGEGTVPATDNTIHDAAGIEKYPEFEGGMGAWSKFIQRNLRYPEQAMEKETQGKVFVSFVVEKDGSISNVIVMKGIGDGCDEEAMRVIKKSPRWRPGIQNGIPVRVRYNIPLSFMLN